MHSTFQHFSTALGDFLFSLILFRYVSSILICQQLYYWSHEYLMYVSLYFVGLGRAFLLTPCTLLLGEYFDKRRSLAFGLGSAGFGIGGFTITPLTEVLFQEYGFKSTFIILSGLVCSMFICASLFRSVSSTNKGLMIKDKR